MELLRQDPVRCTIIVDNIRLQQINHFKYLGCGICYKNKNSIEQKLAEFSQILEILNNTFTWNLV
jgi:hypothetical protein